MCNCDTSTVDNILKMVKFYSYNISNNRSLSDILIHTMEELGELATEVKIETGRSYKTASVDGIIGESIDVIICALDMIFQHSPEITEQEICDIVNMKCAKWKNKSEVGDGLYRS